MRVRGVMMLIASLGRTEEAASGAGWAVMMPMAMLGGAMVPLTRCRAGCGVEPDQSDQVGGDRVRRRHLARVHAGTVPGAVRHADRAGRGLVRDRRADAALDDEPAGWTWAGRALASRGRDTGRLTVAGAAVSLSIEPVRGRVMYRIISRTVSARCLGVGLAACLGVFALATGRAGGGADAGAHLTNANCSRCLCPAPAGAVQAIVERRSSPPGSPIRSRSSTGARGCC